MARLALSSLAHSDIRTELDTYRPPHILYRGRTFDRTSLLVVPKADNTIGDRERAGLGACWTGLET